MRLVDVDPIGGRADWLKRRRDGLGGSDIARVAGISQYGTPWSVYVDKIGAVPLDDRDGETNVQTRGRYLEDGILNWYQDTTGLWLADKQAMILHPEYDWCFCTVDALAYETHEPDNDADPLKGVDAKSATEWSWDQVPLDYQAQAQWSMFVTGLPEWDLAVSHPAGFRIYTVEADHADQETLYEIGRQFWTEHVQAGVAPDITGADNDLLSTVWPEQTPGMQVEVDPAEVLELVQVKADQKPLTQRRNELEAALKGRLADAEEGTVDGRKAVSWKTQWATSQFDEQAFRTNEPFMVHRFEIERVVKELDIRRIKEEEPEVFKRYTKPTRVFRTHIKEE